ncbi:RPH2 [Auxenochlorella protothecoides x Auxenochlorella symbiontica]
MASVLVSAGEVEYVRRGFEAGVRGDGRGPLDFRQIEIETGVIGQATGSARVRLGTTDVLVGVKAEVGPPAEGAPNQGRISFATEFSPIASPSFQGRGGEELASDLTAMLQRTFFRSPVSGRAGLDLTTLSIVSGKSCWVVYVDVLVLAVGGAVVDTASIAVKAALTATLLPKIEMVAGEDPEDEPDYEIDDDPSVSVPLDTRYVPLTLTVSQVGVTPALDLDLLEEASAAAALSVGVDAEGRVVGTTQRGAGGISPETLLDMLDIAEQRGIALHAAIDAHLTRQRANGMA